MRPNILVILAMVALAGCASLGGKRPPVCDGRHRRPANPHGSVLDPAQAPAPTAPRAEAVTHPGCSQ